MSSPAKIHLTANGKGKGTACGLKAAPSVDAYAFHDYAMEDMPKDRVCSRCVRYYWKNKGAKVNPYE